MGHPKYENLNRLMRYRGVVAYGGVRKQHTSTVCGLNVYVIESGISCRLICVCVRIVFYTRLKAIEYIQSIT